LANEIFEPTTASKRSRGPTPTAQSLPDKPFEYKRKKKK
jgi:hypothetical protein